jgi:protein gp37
MAQDSKIAWTTHTFNPWRGCTKVSDGCKFCYADTLSKRNPKTLGIWGKNGTRVVAAESAWKEPVKWNKLAEQAGERHRVFCASLADVFEAADTMPADSLPAVRAARVRLFELIRTTPHLDWLLLTKRPENWRSVIEETLILCQGGGPDDKNYFRDHDGDFPEGDLANWLNDWTGDEPPDNVWLGTSVENQEAADERIPHLLKCPAAVRFLSCEPLLGPVNLRHWEHSDVWKGPAPTDRWSDYQWPEWVPPKLRRHIQSFWDEAVYGRSPRQWVESFVTTPTRSNEGMPAFGRRVGVNRSNWITLETDPAALKFGRLVPCWNNIAAIVFDDGSFEMGKGTSFGPGWLSRYLDPDGAYRHRLHWVIVGGESGPGARPLDVHWARDIVTQCKAAGVACFVKQLGRRPHDDLENLPAWPVGEIGRGFATVELGGQDRLAPAMEDDKGGDPSEWPQDLRVREFPVPAYGFDPLEEATAGGRTR